MLEPVAMARKKISEQLRAAIKAAERDGISRYRLSHLSGVSEAQLSRFYTAQRGLSIDAVDKLAHALDLELAPRPTRRKDG